MEAVNSSSEYSNLSHLIIRSVEKELREDEESRDITGDIDVDIDLTPVMEAIAQVDDKVESVNENITSIEASAADTSDILDLSRDILKLIPSDSDVEIEPDMSAISVDEPDNITRSVDKLKSDIQERGRIDDIIELYEREGVDEHTVRLAIEKLKTDMTRVDEKHDRLMRDA